MGISSEIQMLEPSAKIELFELDLTAFGQGIQRFHAGTNRLLGPIVWQGNSYIAIPVQAEGFEYNGRGQLPRPKLRVANVQGAFSALVRETNDLIGCRVTRRQTFVRFLDAENFQGGNPEADPTAEFPLDIYYIDRKSAETKVLIELELAASIDLNGIQLPSRQIVQNSCPWRYRSAECGYAGGPVANVHDDAVADPQLDVCGKRLKSCKLRFGEYSVLPFGGFPAAGLVRT